MKSNKKLVFTKDTLVVMTDQVEMVDGALLFSRAACTSDYTCYTDCYGSVCASRCNTRVCP